MIQLNITVTTLAELAKMPNSDKAKYFAEMGRVGGIAYLNQTLALIALTDDLGSEEKATAFLKKAEVNPNAVKNAKRLTSVYDSVVRPGHATMEWFQEVHFLDAVAIQAAIAKVGVKKLVEAKVFALKPATQRVECELIAETGLLKAERIAAQEKADAADAKAKADAAKAPVAPPPAAPESSEAPVTPTATLPAATPPPAESPSPTPPAESKEIKKETAAKPAANPMADFDTVAASLEAVAMLVISKGNDVSNEKVRQRIQSLVAAVDAAIAAKSTPAKKAKQG